MLFDQTRQATCITAKYMLTVITILAIVGAVLAFKSRSSNVSYCTLDPTDHQLQTTCTDVLSNSTISFEGPIYYFATSVAGKDCTEQYCTTTAHFTDDIP